MKLWIILVFSFIMTLPVSAQEEKKPEEKKEKMLPVVIAEPAVSGSMSEIIDLTGSVAPTRIARIASPGEGPVRTAQSGKATVSNAVRNCCISAEIRPQTLF